MSSGVPSPKRTWAEVRASATAMYGDEAARACDMAEQMHLAPDDLTAIGGPVKNSLGYRLPFTLYFGAWDRGEAVTLVTAEGIAELPAIEQRGGLSVLKTKAQHRASGG